MLKAVLPQWCPVVKTSKGSFPRGFWPSDRLISQLCGWVWLRITTQGSWWGSLSASGEHHCNVWQLTIVLPLWACNTVHWIIGTIFHKFLMTFPFPFALLSSEFWSILGVSRHYQSLLNFPGRMHGSLLGHKVHQDVPSVCQQIWTHSLHLVPLFSDFRTLPKQYVAFSGVSPKCLIEVIFAMPYQTQWSLFGSSLCLDFFEGRITLFEASP